MGKTAEFNIWNVPCGVEVQHFPLLESRDEGNSDVLYVLHVADALLNSKTNHMSMEEIGMHGHAEHSWQFQHQHNATQVLQQNYENTGQNVKQHMLHA